MCAMMQKLRVNSIDMKRHYAGAHRTGQSTRKSCELRSPLIEMRDATLNFTFRGNGADYARIDGGSDHDRPVAGQYDRSRRCICFRAPRAVGAKRRRLSAERSQLDKWNAR